MKTEEINVSGKTYEEMGFAKLDTDRKRRTGFAEVVFCERKSDEYLIEIYKKLYEKDGCVFGTRASEAQAELIRGIFPQVEYDKVSRILQIKKETSAPIDLIGNIAICTAGTADLSVAEEAAKTAEYFGSNVTRVYDVGVSGLHRLLSRMDDINKANVVVAIAGMEGALASVIGGLTDKPVIAVPTSVGYGANLGGISALLTMINSCANGIAVVNIDNGYGAGYMATQINRLAVTGKVKED
ncbi:MAG: nickel pincer cofactor biosynthesis protein LarB [Lachnospiraceae bacterium]|nr:nickel pincer cofactor biosynthesis protein LarB [Lachnospiraceae bacterium]